MEALSEMKHWNDVCLKLLRMIPVIGSVTRKLESPLKIPGDENLEIPAGINVNVPMGLHHRLAEYFPNPEKFDPDRFLTENSARRQPNTFIPFSTGPRNCIGLKFAILEAKTVVAYILREFEVIQVIVLRMLL
ncbi:Cytochrome P450 4X1 [Orchesella cincta]|uniref:Cytochrome P450 4X1 n=1 Tax=Orchesella cincta TaxID=48709 RepID=A0A1D2NGU9_ORCCI|nr:Cytochrome P450 4X1 [Orchesella cincta]